VCCYLCRGWGDWAGEDPGGHVMPPAGQYGEIEDRPWRPVLVVGDRAVGVVVWREGGFGKDVLEGWGNK